MKNIMIVDDQNIVLKGIASLLSLSNQLNVVAALDSGSACLEYLNFHSYPDVILLDMHMPELNGMETMKQIHALDPIPVLFLTTFDDDFVRNQCEQHGAMGLLKKNIELDDLIDAVLKVAAGNKLFDGHQFQSYDHITPREIQISRRLIEGKTNKEIAAHEHLTAGTVRNYISNLFSKLGVRNRSEAVIKLKQLGLF